MEPLFAESVRHTGVCGRFAYLGLDFRKSVSIDASLSVEYPFCDNVMEKVARLRALFHRLSTRNGIRNLVFKRPSYIIAVIPL